MMKLRIRCLALPALVCVALLNGCGRSGPELGYVDGTVTFDGKPVHGATLTFIPADGKGTTSTGQTDAAGHYKLMYTFRDEGVMLGTHNVKIEKPSMGAEEIAEMKRLGQTPGDATKLPGKYAKVGELTAEVKSGKQTIDFNLAK